MNFITKYFRNRKISKVNAIYEDSNLTTRSKILLTLGFINRNLDLDKLKKHVFSTPFIDAETVSNVLTDFIAHIHARETFPIESLNVIKDREDVNIYNFFFTHDGYYVNPVITFNDLLISIEGFCVAMEETDTEVTGMCGVYRRLSESLLEDLLKLVVILAVH